MNVRRIRAGISRRAQRLRQRLFPSAETRTIIRQHLSRCTMPAVVVSDRTMMDRWRQHFPPAQFYSFDLSLHRDDLHPVDALDTRHDAILVYADTE